jgi:hypothetical protein
MEPKAVPVREGGALIAVPATDSGQAGPRDRIVEQMGGVTGAMTPEPDETDSSQRHDASTFPVRSSDTIAKRVAGV